MLRFVADTPYKDHKVPVKLILRICGEGSEVELSAIGITGPPIPFLGIRSDGTIVRYITQSKELLKLGFQVNKKGVIKIFGETNE